MKINKKSYPLSPSNFVEAITIKKQIVLGHSSSTHAELMEKWKNRLNGAYMKTAAYTIDAAGTIYEHFNPSYCSDIIGNVDMDTRSIVIILENEGWLTKKDEENEFLNWVGHIYNKPEAVIEKRWRNYQYWAPYTEEQLDSAAKLASHLCDEFFIKKYAVTHNTMIDDLEDFSGVLYKSNIQKYYTDLSPAWSCENFKYKLEKK